MLRRRGELPIIILRDSENISVAGLAFQIQRNNTEPVFQPHKPSLLTRPARMPSTNMYDTQLIQGSGEVRVTQSGTPVRKIAIGVVVLALAIGATAWFALRGSKSTEHSSENDSYFSAAAESSHETSAVRRAAQLFEESVCR